MDISKKIDDESPTNPFPTKEMVKTFNRLPEEMRLEIWETISPSGRDAIMGPYDVDVADEDVPDEYYSDDTVHGDLKSVLRTRDPLVVRQVSREALNVWTKASIGKLFMPLRNEALQTLEDTIFGVESIATLWPKEWELKKLFNTLLRRHERGCNPVKTIYIGISAVVCEADVSPIANAQLGEYKFRLFGLTDGKLPAFLDNCNARRRFHQSNECYVTSLQEYWAEHETPKGKRDVWQQCITNNDGKISPELVPVVIATEAAHEIKYRATPIFLTQVELGKLAYSRQTYGKTKEFFEGTTPRLGFGLLRQKRCTKCWPADVDYYTMLDAVAPTPEEIDFDQTG